MIVAEGESCETLLHILLEAPKLTSFAAMREPVGCESLEPEHLYRILHPTFVPWEPQGPPSLVQAGKKLSYYLPENTAVKVG